MIGQPRRVGVDNGSPVVWVIVGVDVDLGVGVTVGVGLGVDGSPLQDVVIDGDE